MKAKLAVLLLITLVVSSIGCRVQNVDMKETWKIVESGGRNIPDNFRQIKLITATHFVWMLTDENGNIINGAGGTYKIEKDVYTESISMVLPGMSNFRGKEAIYTVKIVGKRMTITGMLADNISVAETWEKID